MGFVQSYSFSRIRSMVACTLRGVMDLLWTWTFGAPPPGSREALVGTIAHSLMEEAFKVIKQARETNVEEPTARKTLFDALRKHSVNLAEPAAGEDALEMVLTYFQKLHSVYEFNTEGHAEIKLAFDKDWNKVDFEHKDARFRMVMDRVVPLPDSGMEIEDYKTGIVDLDFTQLHVYGGLAFKLRPDLKYLKLRLTFLRRSFSKAETVTREDLQWVLPFLEEQMKSADTIVNAARPARLEVENFDVTKYRAKQNRYCSSCYWINTHCPITKVALQMAKDKTDGTLPIIPNQETAEQRLRYLFQLDIARKSLRDNLDAWVEDHGPVRLEDENKEFKIIEVDSWTGNAQALVGRFLMAGETRGLSKREIMDGVWPSMRIHKDGALAVGAYLDIPSEEILRFGSEKPGQMFKLVAAPPPPPTTFGELVKQLRGTKPQMEISRKLFGKPRALSRMELGKDGPPPDAVIIELAKILETDPGPLIEMAKTWKAEEEQDGASETPAGVEDQNGDRTTVPGDRAPDGSGSAPAAGVGDAVGGSGKQSDDPSDDLRGSDGGGPVESGTSSFTADGRAAAATAEQLLGKQSGAQPVLTVNPQTALQEPVANVENRKLSSYAMELDQRVQALYLRGTLVESLRQVCNRATLSAVSNEEERILSNLDVVLSRYVKIRELILDGQESWLGLADVQQINKQVKGYFEKMDAWQLGEMLELLEGKKAAAVGAAG